MGTARCNWGMLELVPRAVCPACEHPKLEVAHVLSIHGKCLSGARTKWSVECMMSGIFGCCFSLMHVACFFIKSANNCSMAMNFCLGSTAWMWSKLCIPCMKVDAAVCWNPAMNSFEVGGQSAKPQMSTTYWKISALMMSMVVFSMTCINVIKSNLDLWCKDLFSMMHLSKRLCACFANTPICWM